MQHITTRKDLVKIPAAELEDSAVRPSTWSWNRIIRTSCCRTWTKPSQDDGRPAVLDHVLAGTAR